MEDYEMKNAPSGGALIIALVQLGALAADCVHRLADPRQRDA